MLRSWLPLLAIVALAGALRCEHLDKLSYDFDEAFCWKMTTFPFDEVWTRSALDNHPPLYFYLLWAWSRAFGDSPAALRSLSVALGVATVVAAYLLARQIVGGASAGVEVEGSNPKSKIENPKSPPPSHLPLADVAALTAALLMALSPLQIDWSQRVRMYVLGAALAVTSSWLLLRALHRARPRWRDFVWYAAAATALVYTHYYSLFVLTGQFLYAIGGAVIADRSQRRASYPALAAFALIGAAWLPWLPNFLRHRERVSHLFHTSAFDWDEMAKVCYQIFAVGWDDAPPSLRVARWAAVGCCGSALVMLAWGRGGLRLPALAVLVTFDAAALASLSDRNIIGSRYFVFAHALLVCGLPALVAQLPWRLLRAAALTGLVAASAWLCLAHSARRERQALRPGMIGAMAYLADVRRPDEPVVVCNPILQVAAAAHATRGEQVLVLGKSGSFPYFQGTAVMREEEYVSPEAISRSPARTLWAIEAFDWAAPAWAVTLPEPWVDVSEETFPEWMAEKCRIVVRRCVRHGDKQVLNDRR